MKRIGLCLGILLFALFFTWSHFPKESRPEGMTPEMLKVLAIASVMACFWITEVLPIPATSIMPLALFPLLGIMSTKAVGPAYGDRMVLLLMGGFFIATVIEKVKLHKRIALNVIYKVGTNPRQLLLGFMIATAFLSMWISNTATTLMLLPIVLAVIDELEKEYGKGLATVFLLSIAYSASVGGIGTPIGTPPNLIMISQYNEVMNAHPDLGLKEINFPKWMSIGIPVVSLMIFIMWVYMTHFMCRFPKRAGQHKVTIIERELKALGPMSRPEITALVLFGITAFLWIFRKDLNLQIITIPGWSNYLGLEEYVDDATVAVLMALVMFGCPIGKGERLLDWPTANRIPWGMLLLFGGGIALARGFQQTGLSLWLGESLKTYLQYFAPLIMLATVCCFMTFLTEITSNTAVTTVMMPILATVALSISIDPAFLMLPAAVSASFAFMLPVATAPNAIIYSAERFTIVEMAKTGLLLNLIGVAVVSLGCYFLGRLFVFSLIS